MQGNKTVAEAPAFNPLHVVGMTLLVTLALTAGAITAAHACACCSEAGMRLDQTEDVSEYESAELSQLRFGSEAMLYAGPGFPDDIEGIEAPSDAPYTLQVTSTKNVWTFAVTDSNGKSGTLTFARPKQLRMFEVDPRLSDAKSGGGGPLLYKEWSLKGPVTLSGILADKTTKADATLILQGKGNSCTAAGDFSGWTLQVSGKDLDFAFLGTFVSARKGNGEATAQAETISTATFSCEDGTAFDASFDNSGPYSLAILKLKDQAATPLIQAPSGSGVIYSNGDYTLHTKGDSAVLMRNDKTWLCTAK